VTAFWSATGDTTLARLVDDALRANPDVRGARRGCSRRAPSGGRPPWRSARS
jgi:hypothetical protein